MFWEENHDMQFGKEFLNMTPKVEVIKEIDKLGIQNLKILLSSKNKTNLLNGRKYLQIRHLTKDFIQNI